MLNGLVEARESLEDRRSRWYSPRPTDDARSGASHRLVLSVCEVSVGFSFTWRNVVRSFSRSSQSPASSIDRKCHSY